MEAKELMAFDLVIFDRTYPPTEKKPTRLTLQDIISIEQGKECEPIPLTPEILKNNEFERRGCMSSHKSNIGLIIHHWNDDLCFLNYGKKDFPPIMIPFHYVHELQRALRCCGLWELAENFKVD